MPYSCTTHKLFDVLEAATPAEVAALRRDYRRVQHGLLSVGLKIHVRTLNQGFMRFLVALGKRDGSVPANLYKQEAAQFCIVLPPMGSTESAISLIRCIERNTECAIFGNPWVQLQVCSPGRLDARRSALLAVAFYLGSDTLRRYDESQFATTVSYDERYKRGTRIVLYDAGDKGEFDREFAWGGKNKTRFMQPELPFKEALRTDLLIGTGSRTDVENINLVATLLTHAQYHASMGLWRELGQSFERDMLYILDTHMLSGVLKAPWVHEGGTMDLAGDKNFIASLQELTTYVFEEVERIATYNRSRIKYIRQAPRSSILDEVRTLIEGYRAAIISQSENPEGDIT